MTAAPQPAGPAPQILGRQPVVDLSGLATAEELAAIAAIERAALVVVPQALAGPFARIPLRKVAQVVYSPPGSRVRIQTGSMEVGGDGLGATDDLLIVTGMLVVTSPVTGSLPGRIHVTGSVLAPQGSDAALGPVLEVTGSVTYYRYVEGQQIRKVSGQSTASGALLANPAGEPTDLLVLAGQTVVTPPVERVGFGTVLASGQTALPTAAREVLEPVLETVGQVAWYPGTRPLVYHDAVTVDADLLALSEEPLTLVVFGDLAVADDVRPADLASRLAAVVFGDVIVPPALRAAAMLATAGSPGSIVVAEDPAEDQVEGLDEGLDDDAADGEPDGGSANDGSGQ